MPKQIDTYYEPFCGGASVLRELLDSDIRVEKFICSDLNKDLIDLWNYIKMFPDDLSDRYCQMWNKMNGGDDDKEKKKQYFYMVRERFNKHKDPRDFMFIMRTTTNGMPRYNKKGEFNNSFHVTRNGIQPKTFDKIIKEWSKLLNEKDVEFKHQSYERVVSSSNDFMYLDPPYFNTKGMYYGKIDYDNMWDWLRENQCGYLLSFDGKISSDDFTYTVPKDLFDTHEYLYNGNSSFRRTIGKSSEEYVSESLYLKHKK